MARVLTAVRVSVGAGQTDEWLATLAILAGKLATRGQHLWVFRRDDVVDEWLECTEGKDEASHRSRGPADAAEAALETTLRSLARYDDGTAAARWREVTLAEH